MKTNVLEYLEDSVAIRPRKIAFIDIKNRITYQNLLKKAKIIGCNLSKELNNCMKKPIAVLIDRSVDDIATFFGIIYSGNFYVPIDSDLPANRIEVILKILQPLCLIISLNHAKKINQLKYDCKVIEIGEMNEIETDIDLLQKIKEKTIDTDPVYAIYTSGSTGIPKGVVVSHRSIIDLVDRFTEAFCFTSDCVFGNQAPFDFDISVKDI